MSRGDVLGGEVAIVVLWNEPNVNINWLPRTFKCNQKAQLSSLVTSTLLRYHVKKRDKPIFRYITLSYIYP